MTPSIELSKRYLLSRFGGIVSETVFIERVGKSIEAVEELVQNGELLRFTELGEPTYPVWQAEGANILSGLSEVLRELDGNQIGRN